LTSLITSLVKCQNHADDIMRCISLLSSPEWHKFQYSWTQDLLRICFIQNDNKSAVCPLPQSQLSKAEVVQLLNRVHCSLPSDETTLNLLKRVHESQAIQFWCAAVSEIIIFIGSLKQTRTLIHLILENLSRCSKLSDQETADFAFLKCSKVPDRWCKIFGWSKAMCVTEFIACVNQVASFWSSWSANASTVNPVIHANCFRNFSSILHFLVLEKAALDGCNLSDIKCVVLPEDSSSKFKKCIRVTELSARGFSWNGKVAMPSSDMHVTSEEYPSHLKTHSSSSDKFKRRSSSHSDELVSLGEVTIVAMTTQELQDCMKHSTAILQSIPILRGNFDTNELDEAPLVSVLFPRHTNNFMCIVCSL